MRKYYIVCGELEAIVIANGPFEACDKAMIIARGGLELGEWFYLSEQGFRYEPDANVISIFADVYFSTV